MILILASLLQIFVPYLEKNKFEVPELNQNEFNALLSTNKSIIAFCVEKAYKEMDPVIKSMNNVASLFSDDKYNVTFVFLGKGIAQEVSYANYLNLPSFFFFKKGKLRCSFAYPKTDGAFVNIIQSLLISTSKSYKQKHVINKFNSNTFDQDSIILKTKNEVLEYIGNCYYTILAPPKLFKKALKILYKNPRTECDIVLVDKNALNELDLDNDRLALFRREDNMIVSFSNFSIACVPYYSVINYYSVHEETRPIFAIATLTSDFDNKYKDFLYELSDKYADFVFGFINKDYYAYINTTVGINITNLLHQTQSKEKKSEKEELDCVVLIFNSYKRYTYNISDIFNDEFYSKPFEQEKWINASKFILNSIRKNERIKNYISDPIPQINQSNQENIKTVVGLNFNDFVNQKNKDVIMLFALMDSYSGVSFNTTFHQFYNITKHASNETDKNYCDEKLSFGIIDVSRNSGNFPYLPGVPIIFMYPSKNKSHPIQFRGSPSYDNFLWFLKRYGSFDVPIQSPEGPPFTHKQFEQEFMQLLRTTIKMPEEDKEDFFEWASEIANLTNTDLSKFPGVPKKYCHNHDHKGHEHHHDHSQYDDL